MTLSPLHTPSAPPRAPTGTPRFLLGGDPGGYIEATWWPLSGSLVTELPELITALQLRTGPIWRVVYDPTAWSPAEGRLRIDDRVIRLDPYPFELFGTLYAYGTNGTVIVLRVIPSRTGTDSALRATGEPARSVAPSATDKDHAPGRPITNNAAMGASTVR
ncbi:DUF5994 family protein [Nocardia nova]|uniref:DUF5994 family protein n=1 Tax=Nocardia nova TaxID=37330 RepID=UPI001C71EB57